MRKRKTPTLRVDDERARGDRITPQKKKKKETRTNASSPAAKRRRSGESRDNAHHHRHPRDASQDACGGTECHERPSMEDALCEEMLACVLERVPPSDLLACRTLSKTFRARVDALPVWRSTLRGLIEALAPERAELEQRIREADAAGRPVLETLSTFLALRDPYVLRRVYSDRTFMTAPGVDDSGDDDSGRNVLLVTASGFAARVPVHRTFDDVPAPHDAPWAVARGGNTDAILQWRLPAQWHPGPMPDGSVEVHGVSYIRVASAPDWVPRSPLSASAVRCDAVLRLRGRGRDSPQPPPLTRKGTPFLSRDRLMKRRRAQKRERKSARQTGKLPDECASTVWMNARGDRNERFTGAVLYRLPESLPDAEARAWIAVHRPHEFLDERAHPCPRFERARRAWKHRYGLFDLSVLAFYMRGDSPALIGVSGGSCADASASDSAARPSREHRRNRVNTIAVVARKGGGCMRPPPFLAEIQTYVPCDVVCGSAARECDRPSRGCYLFPRDMTVLALRELRAALGVINGDVQRGNDLRAAAARPSPAGSYVERVPGLCDALRHLNCAVRALSASPAALCG